MIKFLDYETHNDYGKEWHLQLLTFCRFALLGINIQWDDYGSDDFFPMSIVNIGSKCLFGFTFRWGRFEVNIKLIDTSPQDLQWYRENRHK